MYAWNNWAQVAKWCQLDVSLGIGVDMGIYPTDRSVLFNKATAVVFLDQIITRTSKKKENKWKKNYNRKENCK